ncbi:cupin domain-containing protein [Pseudomonas syringae]|uniref:Cupin domain-containing protein n=1 Tax=Pseudomonas syringae CC1417 TaxID=1357272 RepID=A0AAU8LN08_PSESX
MHIKLFVAAACLLLTGHAMADHKPQTVESRVLLKSTASWDGTPYAAYPQGQPELTILKINIPARTSLNWHTHPIPNAAYVVSGELTVEARDSGKQIVLKKGDTLAEMVGIPHRGKTGKKPVELIVFYAGTPQAPLSQQP